MRLNLHIDYALRVLIHLAARAPERISTQDIADAYGISLHHLHKVVRTLGGHGFVALHRGAGGGVELARPADEIHVGAVVRALDEDTALVECFDPASNTCVIAPACGLKSALRGAQEAFYRELDPLTIEALVRGRRGARVRTLTGE